MEDEHAATGPATGTTTLTRTRSRADARSRAGTAAPRTGLADAPAPSDPDRFTFRATPGAAAPAPAPAPAPLRVPVAALWAATGTGSAVLTAFFVLIVSGRVATEGPVVLVITATHGVHLGDVLALAAWGVAVVAMLGAAVATTLAVRR